eukprot:scaffold20361_cov102-Isochrysis_galbana.AAC.9
MPSTAVWRVWTKRRAQERPQPPAQGSESRRGIRRSIGAKPRNRPGRVYFRRPGLVWLRSAEPKVSLRGEAGVGRQSLAQGERRARTVCAAARQA